MTTPPRCFHCKRSHLKLIQLREEPKVLALLRTKVAVESSEFICQRCYDSVSRALTRKLSKSTTDNLSLTSQSLSTFRTTSSSSSKSVDSTDRLVDRTPQNTIAKRIHEGMNSRKIRLQDRNRANENQSSAANIQSSESIELYHHQETIDENALSSEQLSIDELPAEPDLTTPLRPGRASAPSPRRISTSSQPAASLSLSTSSSGDTSRAQPLRPRRASALSPRGITTSNKPAASHALSTSSSGDQVQPEQVQLPLPRPRTTLSTKAPNKNTKKQPLTKRKLSPQPGPSGIEPAAKKKAPVGKKNAPGTLAFQDIAVTTDEFDDDDSPNISSSDISQTGPHIKRTRPREVLVYSHGEQVMQNFAEITGG